MNKIESVSYFDSIVVIESLEEGHQTSKKLASDDLFVHGEVYNVNVTYCPIRSRDELENLFYLIDKDINYGFRRVLGRGSKKPILHIEAHGDQNGLELTNGEICPWPVFADWCRQINRPMLNNLLVVLAVCQGFKSILDVQMNTITPYWGLIGSEVKVNNTLSQFSAFYTELFKTGDIQIAMKKLDQSFDLYLCEKIFTNAFLKYYVNSCRGQGLKDRLERLVTEFRSKNPTGDYTKARKMLRELLKKADISFEKFKSRFLLSDLPGNEDRFLISFEDIEDVAEDYFKNYSA